MEPGDFLSLGWAASLFVLLLASYSGGLRLRRVLPGHQDTAEMQQVLYSINAALVTFTALVLGLLVTSAKTSLDQANADVTRYGIQIVKVDHLLRQYGPDAAPIRAQLLRHAAAAIEQFRSSSAFGAAGSRALDEVEDGIRRLVPSGEFQRRLQNDSLNRMAELVQRRWQLVADRSTGPAVVLYAVLALWTAAAFLTFGLTARHNRFLTLAISVCALAVCTAMFVILEMDTPFDGLIAASDQPLRAALPLLGADGG